MGTHVGIMGGQKWPKNERKKHRMEENEKNEPNSQIRSVFFWLVGEVIHEIRGLSP